MGSSGAPEGTSDGGPGLGMGGSGGCCGGIGTADANGKERSTAARSPSDHLNVAGLRRAKVDRISGTKPCEVISQPTMRKATPTRLFMIYEDASINTYQMRTTTLFLRVNSVHRHDEKGVDLLPRSSLEKTIGRNQNCDLYGDREFRPTFWCTTSAHHSAEPNSCRSCSMSGGLQDLRA